MKGERTVGRAARVRFMLSVYSILYICGISRGGPTMTNLLVIDLSRMRAPD
jgi:hypothetical protein